MLKYKIAILTISDTGSKGKRIDQSSEEIKKLIMDLGEVVFYKIIPDEKNQIISHLKNLVDKQKMDLIFTTGGTGFSPRDNTPEATKKVIEREIPGFPELMRFKTSEKTLKSYLSRSIAGIRKKSLIINLPGSPKAARECLEAIFSLLPHSLEIIQGKISECGKN
ncbi:MAG: MogA/MoaB family molybdenum cofactor biosynthesis protein [bacterium]